MQSAVAKAANYRVDIPRVLQRFSINFKPPDPGFIFFFSVCMQLCIHALCHTHIRVKLGRSAGVFIVTVSTAVCSFYIYVSLVCSCVQIQSDALSTKGVKINVLFTFILTVTQQALRKRKKVKNFLLSFSANDSPNTSRSIQIMTQKHLKKILPINI